MKRVMKNIFFIAMVLALVGCTGIPEGVTPINNFNVEKYQGKWYEIARLDHSFERGLNKVSAEYTIKDNGDVEVINRGYHSEDKEWSEAEGVAKFVDSTDSGHLKVSFFGPFYGSYIIFDLDDDYQHAFVSGPDTSYLWLLSRTPNPPKSVVDDFMKQATALGFNVDDIIMPKH
jgi:apolipoprotein D and lipocalin family protein